MTPASFAAIRDAAQVPLGLKPAAESSVAHGRVQPVGSKGSSLIHPVHLKGHKAKDRIDLWGLEPSCC
jgi:hypothetical protein